MKKISDHFLLFLFFFSTTIYSSPNSYIFPNIDIPSYSNYGTLGLIQLPNARFHEEGTIAFSWSHMQPYLRGSVLAYPFDWFEASFQYTDVIIIYTAHLKNLAEVNHIKIKALMPNLESSKNQPGDQQ